MNSRNLVLGVALATIVVAATFSASRQDRSEDPWRTTAPSGEWRASVDAALDRHQRGISALDHALAEHIRECNPTEEELLQMPLPSTTEQETDR